MQKKRIIYKGVIGTVLSEGRTCYMIAFPHGVRFIEKSETQPAQPARSLSLVKRLN